MAIGINGTSNTITGLAVGGLPDGTVDADTLATNAVTTAKIADNEVTADKLAHTSVTAGSYTAADITVDAQGRITAASSGAIATSEIADEAVTLAKLEHGTGSNNGKFLRANNGADPSFETVDTNLVADTTPQLGGNLDVNTKNIEFGDSGSTNDDRLKFGASGDLQIYHDSAHSYIHDSGTGHLRIRGDNVEITDNASNNNMAQFIEGGAVELYHNNVKKLETVSGGATITGTCTATAIAGDGSSLTGIAGSPSGSVTMWAGAAGSIPTGYLLCNGQTVSRSTYADLFSAIGTTYGAGDGSSTFLVPNLSSRFIAGYNASDGSYDIGDTGGNASVSSSTDGGVLYTGTEDNPNQIQGASSSPNGIHNRQSNDRHQHGIDINHSHSINTLPPFMALAYIIKT